MRMFIDEYRIIKNKITGSCSARKVFANSTWQVGNSIFNMILGTFVIGIVARYFGPNNFGKISYAVAFVALFTAISSLGLETLTIKNIVDETWDEGTILCTCFILRMSGGILLTIVAYMIINIIEPYDHTCKVLVLIMSFTMTLKAFEVIEYWMQAYQRAKVFSIIRMSTYFLISLLRILVVSFNGSIILYAIVYVIDGSIYGIASIITYFKIRGKISAWKFNIIYARDILSQSWYLILAGLIVSLYNRIDQVMLGYILTNKTETGVYSAAVTIAEMWYFVPMAIINSFKPVIMSKKKENEKSYHKSVQTLYDIITFMSLSFGILITIFSRIIVSILYGSEFTKSSNILTILVWAGTFAMLGTARGIWLICEGLQKYSIIYISTGGLVNVILNCFLIPTFGGYGAAIATLIAQITVCIIGPLIFKETRVSSIAILKSFNLIEKVKIVRRRMDVVNDEY